MDKCELKKIIGANLRSLRKKAGYTQDGLAYLLGYSPNNGMISLIENGKRGMQPDKALKAAKLFGVQPSYFINGAFFDSQNTKLMEDILVVIEAKNPPASLGKLKVIVRQCIEEVKEINET